MFVFPREWRALWKHIRIFMPPYRIAVDKLSPKWISLVGRSRNVTVQKAQSIRMGFADVTRLCLLIFHGSVREIGMFVLYK